MEKNRKIYTVISIIIFALTSLLLNSGLFNYSKEFYQINKLDYFFLISINILFWLSASFLINRIISLLVWKKIIRIPVGKISGQWMKDFTASLPYTISTGVLLKSVFWIELNIYWITALVLILLIQTAVRPHILSLFPDISFAHIKPFNTGDWICVKNPDGNEILSGEVYDIKRSSVFIKSAENNLQFVTMEFLSHCVIENYCSLEEKIQHKYNFTINETVPAESVKRILIAAAKQVIDENKLISNNEPAAIIIGAKNGIVIYNLLLQYLPEEKHSPIILNDKIFTIVINNFLRRGISPTGAEKDKQLIVTNPHDKISILKQVELFESLNDEEITQLAESIEEKLFLKGEKIISEGESGQSMFILVEGYLNVLVKNSTGNDVLVGNLKQDDFFGEMSLLTGEPRSATIIAACNSLIYELTKETVSPIIKKRTSIAADFGKIILQRQDINLKKLSASELKNKSIIDQLVKKIKTFFNLK